MIVIFQIGITQDVQFKQFRQGNIAGPLDVADGNEQMTDAENGVIGKCVFADFPKSKLVDVLQSAKTAFPIRRKLFFKLFITSKRFRRPQRTGGDGINHFFLCLRL